MAPALHPKGGLVSVGEGKHVNLQSVQTEGLGITFFWPLTEKDTRFLPGVYHL